MAGEGRTSLPSVLALDAGNSKVDVLLVRSDGQVVGAARRTGVSNVGRLNGSLEVLWEAVRAAARARSPATIPPVARVGVFCLAGVDFPVDERRLERALEAAGWTDRRVVRNDTFAVLRAGTNRSWGVAVVCGAGMNCVGLGPDGRSVRFAALGPLSGDLAAGGEWVGLAALGAAVRAGDGRGARTSLVRTVPAHFGLARAEAVSKAMYRRRIDPARLVELPPIVFAAAGDGDAVARGILDRVADEVVAMATAAVRRLRLTRQDPDVVLGGGLFRAGDQVFVDRIRAGITKAVPRARIAALDAPPVVGAALLGLDQLGVPRGAAARLRGSVSEATMSASGTSGAARPPGV